MFGLILRPMLNPTVGWMTHPSNYDVLPEDFSSMTNPVKGNWSVSLFTFTYLVNDARIDIGFSLGHMRDNGHGGKALPSGFPV